MGQQLKLRRQRTAFARNNVEKRENKRTSEWCRGGAGGGGGERRIGRRRKEMKLEIGNHKIKQMK